MSSRGQLPKRTEEDEAPWWPADGPWGGGGRTSVLLVLGGLLVVVVVVLVVTFAGDWAGGDSDSGSTAVGSPPPPVLASEGVPPGTRLTVGGVPYEVGVGAFTPSTRAAPSGSHLLLAPLVVRNAGSGPAPNPLAGSAGLLVAVGLRGLPPSVLIGPSALLCRNAPATSPLAPSSPVFRGLEPGSCVLDGRAAPSGVAAPSLAPGEEARGILLSSPVPDVVTDAAPSVWVATTPGPPAQYDRVGG
jgi:hypothetical protein